MYRQSEKKLVKQHLIAHLRIFILRYTNVLIIIIISSTCPDNMVNFGPLTKEGGGVERLHAKFHLNVFIVSASGGQTQFWANFDIWGAPVPTRFYR